MPKCGTAQRGSTNDKGATVCVDKKQKRSFKRDKRVGKSLHLFVEQKPASGKRDSSVEMSKRKASREVPMSEVFGRDRN